MTLRTFIIGLVVSFGLPWLFAVVIPFANMRTIEPVEFVENVDNKEGIYHPKFNGRITTGAAVYGANGCYQCHTQVIRPTYAGADIWRSDWGGLASDPDRGDTRRESTVYDYLGQDYAQIGATRNGPDLSNFGRRVETYLEEGERAEDWVFNHMLFPRKGANETAVNSKCPSLKFLFKSVSHYGQTPDSEFSMGSDDGKLLIPTDKARALASYLLSLKRDDAVPASIDYSPKKAAK